MEIFPRMNHERLCCVEPVSERGLAGSAAKKNYRWAVKAGESRWLYLKRKEIPNWAGGSWWVSVGILRILRCDQNDKIVREE